jgi:hypothetical protein
VGKDVIHHSDVSNGCAGPITLSPSNFRCFMDNLQFHYQPMQSFATKVSWSSGNRPGPYGHPAPIETRNVIPHSEVVLDFVRHSHLDVVDVFVGPYGAAGGIDVAADHIEYVVVGRVDAKCAGVVPHRCGHTRPKLLTELAFRGRYGAWRVAVAGNAPADDIAGGPGLKRSFATVSAHCFLTECSVATLWRAQSTSGVGR